MSPGVILVIARAIKVRARPCKAMFSTPEKTVAFPKSGLAEMISLHQKAHGKNDFAEIFKNLTRYKSENNFVNYQNYYVDCSNTISNVAKNFDILVTNFNILHNYFDDPYKIIFCIWLNF